VKIRGYRVECYEVELALLKIPAVNQAFVTHRQDARNETHLIAYVVCATGTRPTIGELRANLGQRLPSYMIPTAFVFLDALPLTATGKIDRGGLPEPDSARPPLDTSYESPRDPIEKSIADICSEILNIGTLGVHDNLFDLGGHSLSAMQIIAQVMKTFRVDVPLQRFYESPTVAGLSVVVATSRDSVERSATNASSQGVPAGQGALSYFQERLWFMEQWDPNKPTYNICQAYRLDGPLDPQAIEESLNTVIARHKILRASFSAEDGKPSQTILPVWRLRLTIADLRTVSETEKCTAGMRLAQKEARQAFDLRGTLLRALLIQLADEEHLLLLTVHQMVCDGWSIRILLSEFWTAYEAISHNETPSLPPLLAQYSDFAVWQRQLLNGDRLESHVAYWHKTLGGTLPALNLPTDYPRPGVETFRGSKVLLTLSEPLTESLNALSRREEVTLFITLMAAFKILLYRYSGQDDIIVGFPIANRSWGETIDLIGFFVNTSVARATISGKLTFREFLFRVRDVCHAAYDHQDLPFEKLVEYLQPPRDLSRNPIFQAMFTFHNMPRIYALPPELRSIPISIDNGTSKVDLTLSLAERDSQLIGFLEYSTDLFNRDTIERMASHFQRLLEAVVADPNQRIATLPVLTEAERHKILAEWNDTAADFPKDKCIHQLFEKQADRVPEAIAAEFDGQEITYRELNRRANQLANYLMGVGIGPEKLVGISVERSIEMVVGLLGVLKAGGAYVPLDPAYPEERLRFVIQDADISVLLTTETLVEDRGWRMEDGDRQFLRPGSGQASIFDPRLNKVVCLDRDWPVIAQQRDNNPKQSVTSDNLAYVIYTSGSTGRPKGVQIEHRSVINCVHSLGERLGFTDRDVLLAVTTTSFDISVLELFLPLIIGGKVVVASREQAADGTELACILANSSVTALQATPSTWRLLIEAGWEGLSAFKILCGGEAMPRDLAGALLTRGEVWNLYGPTESTIWSMVHKLEAAEVSLIGRPIANTKVYILDSHLQPVPIGVHGDLYIGGDGLARGYWNNSELTAERFIPDPFSDEANARLYRTGDRARYRSDGTIEFLGRTDDQVKIRGYRIELGEIESVLMQHSAVNQAVVVPFDEFARDPENPKSKIENPKSLIAYVVSQDKPEPTISELRYFLQSKLPDYMLPSSFVFLDALPMTSNGKLDRKALPPPDGDRPLLDQGFVEPRTEIEELVAQVWREVLKRHSIGIYDNFFDLGGHSLLATRVVARLQSTFHVDLALRKLFERPTVAGLAEHIDTLRRSSVGTVNTPITPVPRNQPLPLSFSQRRLWYLQKVDSNLSAYNIPAAFRIKGDLDRGALERALNEVIARHEVLRSYVKEIEGQPRQEDTPSLRISLPLIELIDLSGDEAEAEVSRLFHADAHQLYDLSKAPLLRAMLAKLPADEHVLILNFHHIVTDGSSLAIFYRELGLFYEAAREGKKASLPPQPIQYGDFAACQLEWLKSDTFDNQIAYWKRQLANLPGAVELPSDFERPAMLSYHGTRVARQLSEKSTVALKTFSRQHGATMFMTLFATFSMLLSRITGQEDIVVGSTIAGRNRPETEGLIGFFINALPLRSDLSGDPTFTMLLQRIREICLDAYTHQEMPFEKIVEELRPSRDPGHNPIFDILFNVADVSERALALTGCEVIKLASPASEAKFDIVLHAPEADGRIGLAALYNTALFREERIAFLLEQWATLLDQAMKNPELPISRLSLLTESSRAALPDPTEALDDKWEGPIHELLADRARRAPDALAVVDSEQSWSYGELDEATNRLANALITAGVHPKDTVAIFAARNSSLVVAVFGVLKAGATFLILDPAYPAARTLGYLRIAQPQGWLQLATGGEPPQELLSFLESADLCCRMTVPRSKNEMLQTWSRFTNNETDIRIEANNPAYIAFTSGSTGEPKGVVCRHGPITHFLPWQKESFDLTEDNRFAMLSGLAYSHLHRDVFTAIYLGATIYIPSPSQARSPDQLANWLKQNAITVLHLTPALGQLLLTGTEMRLPLVHRVFFGGDVLAMNEVRQIRQLAPNAIIGSFYGATETQRAVGYYEITEDRVLNDRESNRTVPLGRGIKDVQLLVLNKSGQLAGIGELGELFVRSPHLAAGYLGDDERTRQMFVTNPYTEDPSDRLYRTGELGRYLPDGNVEWAGRNDRRVNVRGFRVELEEIEAVLKQHPTVQDAAVVLRDFETSTPENSKPETRNSKLDQHLVAYVISTEEDSQSLRDLLYAYISSRLPDYMIPAHFVVLSSLPLSPNGKVDYRALPPVRFSTGSAATAPRNDIEVKLQAIFAEVLGRAEIGIDDNFFRVGGHSLLAARAAARIGDAFGVSLALSTFLEAPTVMGLAMRVASLISSGQTDTESDKDEREEFDL
jgi:amino acid adenylation domain-containing protein